MSTKTNFLAVLFTFSMITIASAKARIPVCFPCESLETVQELPADSEIQKLVGQNVNLAYINNEYGALWMSVWNSDGRFVLSDRSNSSYFELDDEIAQLLKKNHNFDIATAGSPLSFWKKAGGKIILLVVVLLFVWGSLSPEKEENNEAA